MNISDRLKYLIKKEGLNVHQFEKSIGASNGYVHHLKNSISFDKLEKILEMFQELNIEWLLFGKASMLKSSAPGSAVVNEPETPYYTNTATKIDELREKIIALQEKLIEARDKFLDKDKELLDLKDDFIASQKKILELTKENELLKNEYKNKQFYTSA